MHEQIKPRRPWLALLMSLVLPGFGQLYNGEAEKAIWLFLGFAFLTVPALALVALYLPGGLMLPALLAGLAATLAVWIYGMIDAWRAAGRRPDYQPRPWQTAGCYMLVLVLCGLLGLPALSGYVRAHQVEPFRVPSESMQPGVWQGDYFFADKRYNCPGCKYGIRRGDIALFAYPNDRTRMYIKRIIGLPGDRVRIAQGAIALNGKPLPVAQARQGSDLLVTESDGERNWQVLASGAAPLPELDLTVPAGQVFVLGDNRAHSKDSRDFGTVPLQDVVGKARQVWFSHGPDGVRWDRLGKVLQ